MNPEDEQVREVDPIIRDRLLNGQFIPYDENGGVIDEDEQLRRVLEQSALEYEIREQARMEGQRKAREDRIKKFASIKRKFQQLAKLDASNADVYSAVLSNIDSYESGEIMEALVDAELYAKFRRILDNMRVSAEEKRTILSFICV
jgi:hypothetical protein